MTKPTNKKPLTLLEKALNVHQMAKGNTEVTDEEIELALAVLTGEVGQKQVRIAMWPDEGQNTNKFYRFVYIRLMEAHRQGKLTVKN